MELKQVLMQRDNLSEQEADDVLRGIVEQVIYDGEDAEVLLREELGLEPDYLFELLDMVEDYQ